MATIIVTVTDEEKDFFNKMAKFEGKSLSELLKTYTLKSLEDNYDAHIAELAYDEYVEDNKKSRPIKELVKELES